MSTNAIIALVKMIKSPRYGTTIKLEACETLLDYETRDDVVAFVTRYLATVYNYEPPEIVDDPLEFELMPSARDKLWALKLMRQLEAPKVRPRTVAASPPSSAGAHDFSYLAEREAMGRARQDEIARELHDKVETMDEIRARLHLTPAKSP